MCLESMLGMRADTYCQAMNDAPKFEAICCGWPPGVVEIEYNPATAPSAPLDPATHRCKAAGERMRVRQKGHR